MSPEYKRRNPKEIRDRLDIVKTLQELIQKKKPIEILLEESPSRTILKLLMGRANEPVGLARVVYTAGENETPVEVAAASKQRFLFVYERKLEDEFNRCTQVGKYLPGFLDEVVPGCAKRPIWIFRSIQEYRLRLPLVRIRFSGRLLVANFSSTSQPQF